MACQRRVQTKIASDEMKISLPSTVKVYNTESNASGATLPSRFVLVLIAILFYSFGRLSKERLPLDTVAIVTSSTSDVGDSCSTALIPKGIPTFKNGIDLADILQQENMTVGVELGVQAGDFAVNMLSRWSSCNYYLLVDLWAQQENYLDLANVDNAQHDLYYRETLQKTENFKDKRHICRNLTSACVHGVADGQFDFIYVDARHDFKGVYEDMVAWWPKLRDGGIMAGHDYVTQDDGPEQSGQNWTMNYDGTIDETRTTVKGAVDKFSTEKCRQLTIAYREREFNSWAMRK